MKMIIFLGLCFLLLSSCSPSPDMDTIRLYAHASETYAKGHFAETAQMLYPAGMLRKTNKFPPALMLRIKAEYFSGDLKKAEISCRQLLKLQPSSYEARVYLIKILLEKGDLTEAIRLTELLLADNPQDIRILRIAAELADKSGKTNEALDLLNRAAELSGESALVLLDRARLYWRAGKGTEAVNDLRRAKAMLPWDTPLLQSITNLEKIIMETL